MNEMGQHQSSSRSRLIDIHASQQMRGSQIIDGSHHQIDEQQEPVDEQEMLAMKMKSAGINPEFHVIRRPFSMRGSLNMIIRKNEQKNIIEGNRVSILFIIFILIIFYFSQQILQKLRDVKPGIGSIVEWKRHEQKNNYLKSNIGGTFLLKKKQRKQRRGMEFGLSYADQVSNEVQQINCKLPKLSQSSENMDFNYQSASGRGQSYTSQIKQRDKPFQQNPMFKTSTHFNKQNGRLPHAEDQSDEIK